IGEIKPDLRLNRFRFARRLHMKIENQISPRTGRPGHPFRFDCRRGAWLPEEEVAVGIEAFGLNRHIHSAESDLWVLLVAAARRPAAINQDVRVVEDFLVAGQKLNRLDVTRLRDRDRDDEVAEDISRSSGQRVRLWRLDDLIGLPQLPCFIEFWRGGKILSIAFDHSLLNPLANGFDLLVAQSARISELAVAGFRQPWRHVSARGYGHDLSRAFFDFLNLEQAERTRPARVVAGQTVREEDRRDLFVERDLLRKAAGLGPI